MTSEQAERYKEFVERNFQEHISDFFEKRDDVFETETAYRGVFIKGFLHTR